jgi:hypothetical protein
MVLINPKMEIIIKSFGWKIITPQFGIVISFSMLNCDGVVYFSVKLN